MVAAKYKAGVACERALLMAAWMAARFCVVFALLVTCCCLPLHPAAAAAAGPPSTTSSPAGEHHAEACRGRVMSSPKAPAGLPPLHTSNGAAPALYLPA